MRKIYAYASKNYSTVEIYLKEQELAQSVSAQPSLPEVSRSILRCDFKSLFRLFAFPYFVLALNNRKTECRWRKGIKKAHSRTQVRQIKYSHELTVR